MKKNEILRAERPVLKCQKAQEAAANLSAVGSEHPNFGVMLAVAGVRNGQEEA